MQPSTASQTALWIFIVISTMKIYSKNCDYSDNTGAVSHIRQKKVKLKLTCICASHSVVSNSLQPHEL